MKEFLAAAVGGVIVVAGGVVGRVFVSRHKMKKSNNGTFQKFTHPSYLVFVLLLFTLSLLHTHALILHTHALFPLLITHILLHYLSHSCPLPLSSMLSLSLTLYFTYSPLLNSLSHTPILSLSLHALLLSLILQHSISLSLTHTQQCTHFLFPLYPNAFAFYDLFLQKVVFLIHLIFNYRPSNLAALVVLVVQKATVLIA